jgi:Co/Zn/Cd efflux system component
MAGCCDDTSCVTPTTDARYRRVLWAAFLINLMMFGAEIVASVLSRSVSVRADALDFLGDAANYAVALLVFGMMLRWRAGAALLKGCVMGAFGLWVAASALLNAIAGTIPQAEIMGIIGFVAFGANLLVAALLYRYRTGDSQALSVWLCTRNDCLANVAVIMAAAGVWVWRTYWPDIVVAAVIAFLGLSSAFRVIRQALEEMHSSPQAAAE